MRTVIDVEANSLTQPTKIWLIVCKDIDTNELSIFRSLHDDTAERRRFQKYGQRVTNWIGHNIIEYDFPVLHSLIQSPIPDISTITDTLILSRLINYSRVQGHSLESYGNELGLVKLKNSYPSFFSQWSQALEDYCVRDVEICEKVYRKYDSIISDSHWTEAIRLEHRFQRICNDLHHNGFAFNVQKSTSLLKKVQEELATLDDRILAAFPPKEVLIKEFTPKLTKFGTISRTSVPRALHHKIHEYEDGKSYRHTRLEHFNPSSHKQLIAVLTEAGWQPVDKTQAHIEAIRAKDTDKIKQLSISGWKINELNLGTLPSTAPEPARLLAKRILLESRRRTLTEWLAEVQRDGRIHGKFIGIGAWTHRMAHQRPNTANITREFKEDGSPKLLGRELRELWIAPKNKLLVGVDAEGIQLRIFAHYINDKEFTNALINGSKSEKTDPHSLNQRVLGNVCKTRQAAKRFVYALLLGGGLGKLAAILECETSEAKKALDRLLQRYQGFAKLRKTNIPHDAKRGYFIGLDGRHVTLPGETQRDREHLCMSGYLQNGEAIIIKRAACITDDACRDLDWRFVNIVHDELQSEVKNSLDLAIKVAKIKAAAIREAGEYYKLRCPMAGSYWNDDTKKHTIGTNWYRTH